MLSLKEIINLGLHLRKYLTSSATQLLPTIKMRNVYKVEDSNTLEIACKLLCDDKVIGLPTDTVYGLACDANNEKAIQKVYDIKGRHFDKPVSICVKNLTALRRFGDARHLEDELLKRLFPGPITIVIERTNHLSNQFLNPKSSKIGIRIPDYQFIRNLCEMYNAPLALTSANRSSEKSSLNVDEFSGLWPELGAVFDAGQIGLTEERRSASTVIDLSQPGFYKILREGVALNDTLEILQEFGIKPNKNS
ncbi:yrdC domain-containing protein, mitochondrial-like [Teleopsis dalmanni]|uniref:yrdC domain-containing protein, mitochondrial-like n=1 Tax=Teleopsis dalmanni TaxID=139649 RepID=UPI0018CCC2AA|nr:yrdC domain-containing protein, mitochondrial-like [Teleopsis dalmanni]